MYGIEFVAAWKAIIHGILSTILNSSGGIIETVFEAVSQLLHHARVGYVCAREPFCHMWHFLSKEHLRRPKLV